MTTSTQANEPFETPPREQIPGITRQHVAAMEQSDAEEVWIAAGMSHVLLRTIGRRSGQEHKVALPFWRDPDGNPVVVASFSGAPQHPSWYLNLSDRTANPELLVRVQQGPFWARADILEGAEYERIWGLLTADRPFYNDYQRECDRRIPLVRLVRIRDAD